MFQRRLLSTQSTYCKVPIIPLRSVLLDMFHRMLILQLTTDYSSVRITPCLTSLSRSLFVKSMRSCRASVSTMFHIAWQECVIR